jgi:exonuclease III
MPEHHRSIDQLIAEEQRKTEEARARIAELKARQRAEDRKKENHRKIIVGAAAMAHMRIDPQFRKAMREALNVAVTDPKHRAVIPDLLDEQAFNQAMKAMAKQAAAEAKESASDQAAKGKTPVR